MKVEQTGVVLGVDLGFNDDKNAEIWNGYLYVDQDASLADLRWIGTEFVYFPDIPTHEDTPTTIDIQNILHELLEAFTGLKIPEAYLRFDSTSNPFLSGEDVSRLIIPWARRVCNNGVPTSAHSQNFHESFRRIIAIVDEEIFPDRNYYHHPDSDLFLAVGTTLHAIAVCARACFKDTTSIYLLDSTSMLQDIITFYRAKLEQSWSSEVGEEIERLLGAGISFLAYASASEPTINRSKFVDPEDYTPLHIHPHCSCEFVKPSLSDIVELLSQSQRKVPVVVYDGKKLAVIDGSQQAYIAISHVWADGLGSTTEEGLPTCQVKHISRLAHQLIPNGAFWIDALCVPGHRVSRRQAIGLMAETYKLATAVLVIDGSVRTTNTSIYNSSQCTLSSPKEESLLRITTSGWMQRIWTLQEGMLARELCFEVSDGVLSCTAFNGPAYSVAKEVIPLLKHRLKNDDKLEYLPISDTVDPPECTYNELIPLLRHRRTSRPEDETVAIAGLLRINVAELVCIPSAQERMRLLLMRCSKLPRHIATYGWSARRLQVPSFEWAPASIGELLWGSDPLDPLFATADEHGLKGLFSIIQFPTVDLDQYPIVVNVTRNETDYSEHLPVGIDRDTLQTLPFLNARTERTVSGVRIDISPYSYVGERATNAVLFTRVGILPTQREEPVAVVHITSTNGTPVLKDGKWLKCQFVASGKFQVDPSHVAGGWQTVEGTMDSLRPTLVG